MKLTYLKDLINIFIDTYTSWIDDKCPKLGASLSFYSILSLVPFLVILLYLGSFILDQEHLSGVITENINEIFGEQGVILFKDLMQYSFFSDKGVIPTLISGVILIFGSLGVFMELKDSLNIIWGIEVKPGRGMKVFFKNRLFTFPIILMIGGLLMFSLIISTITAVIYLFLQNLFPEISPILQAVDYLVSFIFLTILFGILFNYLPDVKIGWKFIWQGALFTSLLFNIGKYLIGLYLFNTYYGSVFGAAGSIVLMIIWIYYSSLIFFFGAEFTFIIRTKYSGVQTKLSDDFVRIKKMTQQLKEISRKK